LTDPSFDLVYETYAERVADDRPVAGIAGSDGGGYAALGGVTNFSSLVDGCDRLPPGALSDMSGMYKALEGTSASDGSVMVKPPIEESSIQNISQSMAYSAEVKRFYAQHNPSKIKDGTMQRLLEQHRGREDQLLEKIQAKYAGGAGVQKAPAKKQKAIRQPEWVDTIEQEVS